MMTSNYKSLKLIVPPLHPVSISRGKPRWLKGGWLAHVAPGTLGRNYDALAPSAAALKGTEDAYHAAFSAQLAALDPRKVYDELGENAVLLCFCDVGRMCHRRIVAEWIEAALNVEIPELSEDPDGNTELWTTEAYAHYMELEQKMAWYEALGIAPKIVAPVKTAHRQIWNAKAHAWEDAK